jgi:hypothetical protein
MDKELPIEFSWGIFCQKAITDQDTKEVSIISVIPSMKIDVGRIETIDSDSNINISLGKLHVVALFKRLDDSTIRINEDLIIEILQPNFEAVNIEGEIVVEPTEDSIFVNVKLEGAFINVSALQESSNYSFEVTFKIKNQQLGKIVLPVKVKFESLESN